MEHDIIHSTICTHQKTYTFLKVYTNSMSLAMSLSSASIPPIDSLFMCCCSRTWSNTGASRSISSQRGQGFIPRPWLLSSLETICRLLVCHSPKSSAMSHSLSHPPFLATSAICGAFSSHSSILFFLSSYPITFFTSCILIWSALPLGVLSVK